MPAVFDNQGVRFQYPENWTLEWQESDTTDPSVSVFSPGGAFWTLSIHPPGTETARLVQVVLDALREEYQELDAQEAVDSIGDTEMIGYDVNFYCLDLCNTAVVRGFHTRRASYVLLCQAEDREFERVREVFRAMTTSLIREGPDGAVA
ncbi:MAG: hypothetical protein WDZ59_14555 [Pirellulales bacterium]